jgi:hypothetical protein
MKLKQVKNKRRIILIVSIVVLTALLSLVFYRTISRVNAAERTWTQTDWRGGITAGVITDNATTFLEESNIDYSSEGYITLAQQSGWDLSEWNYRREITFNNTLANLGVEPEDLIDFPVLIKLENGVNIDYSKTNDNGSDIRFIDPDGTQLSYEIEQWDETGDSFVWVKVPQINVGDQDYIYMYYGNTSATDSQNTTDVWSNGYTLVLHMAENSGDTVYDSTANHNDGTLVGTTYTENFLGGLRTFFGSGNYIILPNDVGYVDQFTSFAWFKSNGTPPGGYHIIFGGSELEISIPNSTGEIRTGVYTSSRYVSNHGSGILDGDWHYLGFSFDGSSKKSYIDGSYVGQQSVSGTLINSFNYRYIGKYGSSNTYYANGYIDEVRISNIVRTQSWLAGTYVSQKNQLNSYGLEEGKYSDSGYLVSNIFDTGYPSDWANLSYIKAGGGLVEIKARSSSSPDMAGALDWEICDAITSSTDISTNNCVNDEHRYIQYRVEFDIQEQLAPPLLQEIQINFSASDQTPPVQNVTALYMSNSVENNDWVNFEPTINWTEGIDNDGGNGIEGYCISLEEMDIGGISSLLDPKLTSGVLSGLDDGVSNNGCPYIVTDTTIDLSSINDLTLAPNKKYYFSIKAIDYAGNVWSGVSEEYQNLVWFRYDDTKPQNVMYISTPSIDFGNVNDMFFNWPITGSAQATDLESDILGWQYAVNSSESSHWRGTALHTKLGVEYIPSDGETNIINLSTEEDGDDVIIGNNTIYFRAIDNAGNVSTYVTGGISYGGAAPEFPAESVVIITPETSISNDFSISWPAAIPGDGDEIESYYYMINTQPPASLSTLENNNNVYIPTTELNVGQGKLVGAVKGINNVYVVAVDNRDNYSPTKAIHGTFELNSTLPDAPLNLSSADLSVKDNELWRIALTWDEPAYKGNGDLTYIIERSTDKVTWTEVSRTTGLSYTDIVPESKSYYYKVATVDSSNESMLNPTYSTYVDIWPKGRYEEPPELISNPVVSEITTRNAKIAWVTDRECDSKIQLGVGTGDYFPEEMYRSEEVTSHVVELTNLLPGTQYYYRVKWTDADGNTGVSRESVFQTKPAPRVEDVNISTVGLNYAILDITTKGAISANILYGRTKNYGGSKIINTSTAESEYSVMLTELEDGTEYHYTIVLTDEEGFEYENFGDMIFTTPPRPQVSNVQIQEKKGVPTPTIEVFWESNIPVNSIVKYSKEGKTLDKVDMEMIEGEHVMEIEGLDPDSAYQLTVEGVDAMGNRAVSEVYAFTTATDTRPPEVFGIKSEGDIQSSDIQTDRSRSAQLIISWETDEPSTSQVLYGEGAANDGYPYSTQTDAEIRYKHVMIVSNLAPSKVYHFKVVSKDSVGNVGESGSVTSITPKGTDTVVESVLGSLSRIFNFF